MERGLKNHALSAASEAEVWMTSLRADGAQRDHAISRLYELLLRAARHELSRRRAALYTCVGRSSRTSRPRPPTTR